MGWTYTHRSSGQSHLDFFQNEFDKTKEHIELLDSHQGKHALYFAALIKKADPPFVTAFVILNHWVPRAYHNFGYKEMDESAGPNAFDCPDRILDRLSPTKSEWAIQWRAQCRIYNAEQKAVKKIRFKIGDTIVIDGKVSFMDGYECINPEFDVKTLKPFCAYMVGGLRYRLNRSFTKHYKFKVWRNGTCL